MPATTRASFEGDSYVTGFSNTHGEVRFNIDSPHAGVFDLAIRYSAPPGGKGYTLAVNDVGSDGFFPPSPDRWSTFDAGKIELAPGQNAIVMGKGWGYYDLDSIRLTPSMSYAMPKPIPPKLATTKPSPAARALMKTLVDAYGDQTFSGAISDEDHEYIRTTTGATPAIAAGDLIDYTPSRIEHGVDPSKETERLIAAHRAGQIVTLCWHWNAPANLIDKKEHVDTNGNKVDASWYRGFYTNATTFDFAAALDHPDSREYRLLIRDIDAIAVQLRRLRAASVPVLWRPLHESDGKWFWWGTRGPDQFKKLWRLLFERLTVHHGLDNLIWVYTYNDPNWYPGDDVVDIVGVDAYPSKDNDTLASTWSAALKAFDGRKLIALTEFGGVPDIDRMHRLGIRWSYFASWSGPLGPQKNDRSDLIRIYQSPCVRNLDKPKR
jgi:mannan endo-1,4-beta-mannosidase